MSMKIHEEIQMEIESNFNLNLRFYNDNSSCLAKLRQEVRLKNDPSAFNVMAEIVGEFSCEGITTECEQKEAHIQAYMQLFPYVQNMISQLTVNAGLPPLMIQMSKLSLDDVNIERAN